MESYICRQVAAICEIMSKDGFLETTPEGVYRTTDLGVVASHVAEVHPLILSQCIVRWEAAGEHLTTVQLVGLFSCFTDCKVAMEYSTHQISISDTSLQSKITEVYRTYLQYNDHEQEAYVHTGIKYDDSISFDLVELAMGWCSCETELECRQYIQQEVDKYGISVGDFVKALLKIVAIAKEWMNVCELRGMTDLLYRLSGIEPMLLKYVATSQSLYV
jgi:hypothetical protein